MRQSSAIFGTLLLAFVIYITMRGQMPSYIALFKPKQNETKSSNSVIDGLGDLGDKILGGNTNKIKEKANEMIDKAKKALGGLF